MLEKGERRQVAVKILRPGIEKRFKRDLDSYRFAAELVERVHAPSRRLKPLAVVENLARTTELEMDLRLEAAAMSEMAEYIGQDAGFRIPRRGLETHRQACADDGMGRRHSDLRGGARASPPNASRLRDTTCQSSSASSSCARS